MAWWDSDPVTQSQWYASDPIVSPRSANQFDPDAYLASAAAQITVKGPNGVIINFPAGTDAATIDRVMRRDFGGPKLVPVDHDPFAGPGLPNGFVLDQPFNPDKYLAYKQQQQAGPWDVVSKAPAPGFVDQLKSIPGGLLQGVFNAAAPLAQATQAEMGQPIDAPGAEESAKIFEKNVTGELPSNGTYGRAVGEFLGNPASYVGPGGVGTKALSAIVGGLGSTAGEEAGGTAGKLVGTLAGSVLGGRMATPSTVLERAAAPTVAELKGAARAGYQSPEVAALTFKPESVANASAQIRSDLLVNGYRAANTPQTFAILSEMRPPEGAAPNAADLDSVRKALGVVARNFNDPPEQAAALTAMRSLDKYLGNLSASDVAAGDASKAIPLLNEARANWAAASRAENVQRAINNAEINAGAANSGANVGNATRQQLKQILKRAPPGGDVPGYDTAETDALRQAVLGTPVGNALRTAGNVFGGGGGLGMLHGAGAGSALGFLLGGPAGAAAGAAVTPVIARGIKALGNRAVANQAAAVDEMLRMRSPLYASRLGQTAVANSMLPGNVPASALALRSLLVGVPQ